MGTRGRPPQVLLRRIALLLLAVGLLVVALAPMAGANPNDRGTRSAPATAANRLDTTWTAEQAIAALTAAPVAQLPGSPAVIDAQQLIDAIGTSNVKILTVPFAQPENPLDRELDEATDEQLKKVRSWAAGSDVDLVAVIGLNITLGGIFEQRPDTLSELQRIMVRSDLTQNLLFSIAYEQSGREAADATERPGTPETPVPADPAEIEPIAAAMVAEKYYATTGIGAPEKAFKDWQDVGPDRVVRVALLAGPTAGEPLVDHLGPLTARFPDDIVVVATGRWVQMAGPEQNLLDSAVLYGYGAYYDRVVQNDAPVANLALGMLRRVGDLRTGSVADQQGPSTDDPVSGVSPALPWLFAGTAVIVVAGLVLFAQRRRAKTVDASRNERRAGSRTTAQLSVLSEQILQLDGLARDGAPRTLVSKATERYGTARELLVNDGDIHLAQSALDEASALLIRAAADLDVPLVGAGDR